MKYICRYCKTIFDDDSSESVLEDRGEYWGIPCSESMTACPCCLSTDYFEYEEEDTDEDEEDID